MSKNKERRYASARGRAEQHDAGFQDPYIKYPEGATRFKPKTGFMLLDILSYEVGKGNTYADEGMLHYERTFFVHRGIGANNESHLCAAKTFGKPCPVCEHRATLRADSDDEEMEKLIYALKPSERQLFNLIDAKNPSAGVQIFEFSHWNFGKKLDEEIRASDDDDGWEDFASYAKGMTLKVNFSEDSFAGSTFNKAETIHFKTRKTEYDEDDMLEQVHCLDDLIVETPYDKLKEIFLQLPVDDDGDEKPAKRKGRKADPDPDLDDDDDAEEKAAAKRKAKKKAAADAAAKQAEEDEEAEEEAALLALRKKRKAKKAAAEAAAAEEEEGGASEEAEEAAAAAEKKAAAGRKAIAAKKAKKDDDDDGWDDFDGD